MKTSLAGIACLAWFILLNLSHRGDAHFLDESCVTSTPSEADAWTVVVRNETHPLCAGSLIHRQFVLTAAQCVDGYSFLMVTLGRADDLQEPPLQVLAKQGIIHRLYSREKGLNDITLLKLSSRVSFSDQVRPICILRNATELNGINAIRSFKTFGWGIGTDRQISNTLEEITINRFNRSSCGIGPEQSSFCGGPSRKGSCGGDIGGPLTKEVKLRNQERVPVQFGIVGSGQGNCGGARSYVDVTSYADWIGQVVRAYDDPQIPEVTKNQRAVRKGQSTEDIRLYTDCGDIYLMANIYGPDFMAKGVIITYRFVLTTARNLTEDVSSLRVGVEGSKNFQEIAIELVYKHPEVKTDIALLKLRKELIPEDVMKPICILRRPAEQSQLTILDIERKETSLLRTYVGVSPLEKLKCSASLLKPIQLNDICVQTPRRIKQVFGIRGNVVSQSIEIPGTNTTVHPLFGIVKYSVGRINIITDVTAHADWIASVVSQNSVKQM